MEPLTDFSFSNNQSRISALDRTLNTDGNSGNTERVYRRILATTTIVPSDFMGGPRESSELEFVRVWLPRFVSPAPDGSGRTWALPGEAVNY